MKLSTTTSEPIEVEIDEATHTLRRLSIADFATLAEKLRGLNAKAAKVSLLTLKNTGGLSEDKLPMIIREFTKEPSYAEVRRWVHTPPGTIAALELAGLDSGAMAGVGHFDLFDLCQRVAFPGEDEDEPTGTIPNSQAAGVTGSTGSESSAASPTTTPASETPAG